MLASSSSSTELHGEEELETLLLEPSEAEARMRVDRSRRAYTRSAVYDDDWGRWRRQRIVMRIAARPLRRRQPNQNININITHDTDFMIALASRAATRLALRRACASPHRCLAPSPRLRAGAGRRCDRSQARHQRPSCPEPQVRVVERQLASQTILTFLQLSVPLLFQPRSLTPPCSRQCPRR